MGTTSKVASAAVVGLGVLLCIVGLLSAKSWADATTTWTAFGALATVAAAVVAIWTLIALKQDSADRTRPVILAELKPAVLTRNSELLISNVGQSVARNVKIDFDPPLQPGDDKGTLTPFLIRRYNRTIPTWAPGMTLDNFYQGAGKHADEPVPDEFAVIARYEDAHGRHYEDRYTLSMGTIRDQSGSYPGNTDDKGMYRRWVQALEAIARGVGRH